MLQVAAQSAFALTKAKLSFEIVFQDILYRHIFTLLLL